MNISRSKVRQSALCYIYTFLSNGSQPVDKALFWQMAQEKDRDHLRTAQAKAVQHACRASVDSARLLAERLQQVENRMHADLTAATLREEIARYAEQSARFDAALKALQYCQADKCRDTTDQLALCTGDVLRLAAIVEAMGRDLLPRFADFPAYRQQLDALAAAINRRARMLQVCTTLGNPLELAGTPEYVNMVRLAQDMQELRPAVEDLATRVIARIPLVEPRLEGMLENYSVERLDMVDKAILYIALYELEENGLDVPIVVSEATALANEYSGSKSAQFIHGVIAAAARK
jgi:transcription termination factor NusB